MPDQTVTVITDRGAQTSGPMPQRDAEIVTTLAEIAGAITNTAAAKR